MDILFWVLYGIIALRSRDRLAWRIYADYPSGYATGGYWMSWVFAIIWPIGWLWVLTTTKSPPSTTPTRSEYEAKKFERRLRTSEGKEPPRIWGWTHIH